MPIVGRNRKARVRDVWDACWYKPSTLRPKMNETFEAFHSRLLANCEDLDFALSLLLLLGEDEPSQREYLYRLSCVRDLLGRCDQKLCTLWPNR
jgi:hypothetical protein